MAGKNLAFGGVVKLTISLGPEPVETTTDGLFDVPNVVNKQEKDAKDLLSKSNLKAVVKYVENDSVAKNYVISQSPTAGNMISKNGEVFIYVSLGLYVEVPNVGNDTQSAAEKKIKDRGLTVTIQYENSQTIAKDKVIKQDPSAGSRVEKGSAVRLTISTGPPGDPEVPNVVGRYRQDAIRSLEDMGLIAKVQEEASDSVAEDRVISQSPKAGVIVKKGSTVTIYISTGRDEERVPDVVGSTRQDATRILENIGFTVRIQEENNATVAVDRVISQNPVVNTMAKKGSVVYIYVSKGPGEVLVEVPDVVGSSKQDAMRTLEREGFVVKLQEEESKTVAEGRVISQDPAARRFAPYGSTVTIYIAKSPMTTGVVSVPNVVGENLQDAERMLERADLYIRTQYKGNSSVPKDRIISQSPEAGESVAPGSYVVVIISTGPEDVLVPNVVGETLRDAESALRNENFAIKTLYEESTSVDEDKIISQDPAANSYAPYGSTVTITVSIGPPKPTVPNLVNMHKDDAINALKNIGLNAIITIEKSDSVAEDRVISHDPREGEKVSIGSSVTLVVSSGNGVVQVTVPDVTGKTQSAAEDILDDLGLRIEVKKAESDKVDAGKVITQSPAAGTKINAGGSVTITVSTGKAGDVIIPLNILTLTDADAKKALEALGFTVKFANKNHDTEPEGKLLSVSVSTDGAWVIIAPGASAPKGSELLVTISSGPEE